MFGTSQRRAVRAALERDGRLLPGLDSDRRPRARGVRDADRGRASRTRRLRRRSGAAGTRLHTCHGLRRRAGRARDGRIREHRRRGRAAVRGRALRLPVHGGGAQRGDGCERRGAVVPRRLHRPGTDRKPGLAGVRSPARRWPLVAGGPDDLATAPDRPPAPGARRRYRHPRETHRTVEPTAGRHCRLVCRARPRRACQTRDRTVWRSESARPWPPSGTTRNCAWATA